MKRKRTDDLGNDASRGSLIDVIIETPKGSRNKFAYEPASGRFKLSKILPEGMVFPYDFGFVPLTTADDGDPLDVLVLTDERPFPGCELRCALIGVIEAKQRENGRTDRNDRLIAAAEQSLLYAEVRTLADLNPNVLAQIDAFFVNYQKVRGVEFTILGHGGTEKAHEIVRQARPKVEAA